MLIQSTSSGLLFPGNKSRHVLMQPQSRITRCLQGVFHGDITDSLWRVSYLEGHSSGVAVCLVHINFDPWFAPANSCKAIVPNLEKGLCVVKSQSIVVALTSPGDHNGLPHFFTRGRKGLQSYRLRVGQVFDVIRSDSTC